MTASKKREITIEVERVRVVSNLKKSKGNCENCAAESEFISLSNAARIFEIDETEVEQMALERTIHLKLNHNDEMLVCLQSLKLVFNCL
jgi:hypothetical protein